MTPPEHYAARDLSGAPSASLAAVPEGIVCPDCTYDLRGLTSERCPECGFDLTAMRRQESGLPWRRRRELGRVRAFCQTVWLVTAHPRRLRIEAVIPQPVRDAQRFWILACVHLALIGVITFLLYLRFALRWGAELGLPWGTWVPAAALIAGLGWFWMLPGVTARFLRSHTLSAAHEARVQTLAYYVWAPAVWLCVPAAFYCAAWNVVFPIFYPSNNHASVLRDTLGAAALDAAWYAMLWMARGAVLAVVALMQRRLYTTVRDLLRLTPLRALATVGLIDAAALALLLAAVVLPATVGLFSAFGRGL